jgi:two-component system OmpR family sensor kinase
LWYKLPKNKNIQKTIFNVVSVYLLTTIILVLTLSFLYIQNQKEQIFEINKKQLDIRAIHIIDKLELLHDNITNEIAIYPRYNDIKSAIYNKDKNLIFSTFKEQIVIENNHYFFKDDFIYFIYEIESYYLGTNFLVIQKKRTYELKSKFKKIVFIVFLIIIFLVFTSFILVRILIKPLSDNITLLDKFIKDTTHELNTPLSAILNNIEMLDLKKCNNKNIKKINRIKIGAITISNIYEDLSFLLLNNKVKLNKQNINIPNELIQRVEYFRILANSRNITIKTDIQKDIYLNIDKNKLHRLFDNLISNAIKYAFLNTTIKIILNNNELIVEDSGIGMNNDEIKEIFTRYKRFNNSVGGFGIGYDIIYAIIKEYDFSIDITSQKQIGTKVIIKWQK